MGEKYAGDISLLYFCWFSGVYAARISLIKGTGRSLLSLQYDTHCQEVP